MTPETFKMRHTAQKYIRAKGLLNVLRKDNLARKITGKEYAEVREMALNGNMDDAYRRLEEIIYDKP